MSVYAIGDLHLAFDPGIEKPMDVFGKEWENHPERLKENWVGTVADSDIVIIAGDISWGLRLEEAMPEAVCLPRRWETSRPSATARAR